MRAHLKRSSAQRPRLSTPAALAVGATVLFVAISIWWLLYDKGVPGGGDPGRHLAIAIAYGDRLEAGDIGSVLETAAVWGDEFFYPPLVHLIGGVPPALGLPAQDWSTIAINLVFVPMLAAGCFLVGRMTYGPTAGALAAIFALATPMVLSLFHVFLLDAPLAGAVAITVWALLASDRFSRTRESVLAGALIGLATLVKTPALLFIAGPVAVMLIGGGWRQWRNLLLAAGLALLIAGPYYLAHVERLFDASAATTIAGGSGEVGGASVESTPRFSFDNLGYYGWVGVNLQYLAPFALLFGVGLIAAVRELRERRHLPELLAGLAVGYIAATLVLSVRDPRYTLPLVVYVAVISTGWITSSRRPLLAALGAAVMAAAVVVNVASAIVEVPTIRVPATSSEEGADEINEPGHLTLTDGRGYVVGRPRPDPLWDRLLTAAEREGLDTAQIYPRETPLWGTDKIGFDVLAREYGVNGPTFVKIPPHAADLRINTWWTSDYNWVVLRGLPEPCGTVEEGALPPPASEAVELSIAVERRVDGHYQRWCEF